MYGRWRMAEWLNGEWRMAQGCATAAFCRFWPMDAAGQVVHPWSLVVEPLAVIRQYIVPFFADFSRASCTKLRNDELMVDN